MTVRDRVASAGRVLATIVLARSILLGVAAGLIMAGLAWPMAVAYGTRVAWVIVLAGTVAAIVSWWLYRRFRGPGFGVEPVALWLEERVPALGYRLVTAVETGAPASIERSLAADNWTPRLRHAARQALLLPAALVGAAIVMVVAS